VVLPAEMPQFFLPVKQPKPGGATLVYQCLLLGFADVIAEDKKMGRKYTRALRLLAPAPAESQAVDWSKAESIGDALDQRAMPDASWAAVPDALNAVKKVKALEKAFGDSLTGFKVMVPTNATLKMSCDSSETPDAFRARCQSVAWRDFEKKLAAEKQPYETEFKRYGVSMPADEPVDANAPWPERWRQFLRSSPVQRTSPAATLSAKQKTELENLESEWHGVRAGIAENSKHAAEQITEMALTPKKSDIKVLHFGLAWAPYWQLAGTANLVPAYG